MLVKAVLEGQTWMREGVSGLLFVAGTDTLGSLGSPSSTFPEERACPPRSSRGERGALPCGIRGEPASVAETDPNQAGAQLGSS